MIVATSADWANALATFVVGAPGIVSAIYAFYIHRKIKTPSGTSIGVQVENALHTGLANNYQLRAIGDATKAPPAPAAHAEAKKVPDLPEGHNEGK